MSKVDESDWKRFTQIKDIAMERFHSESLSEYREILSDESKSNCERHLLIHKISDNRNRRFNLIFDGHSRSKMTLQLLAIRGEKLVDSELLKGLSEQLLEKTNPDRVSW